MKTQTIYLIVGLFVALIIGMIIFTVLARNTIETEPINTPDNQDESAVSNSYGVERIDAKYFYVDGKHIIAGSIMMPTPCDLLETEAMVAESMPEQVTFVFSVINTADTCAQVMTEQRFMVEAQASSNASFQATFMGAPVELNLVPALEGESPDDFELFIKG